MIQPSLTRMHINGLKIFSYTAALLLLSLPALAQAPGTYTLSLLAGTGAAGYAGDGAAATSAQLNNPLGLVYDKSGNLYFSDQVNHRIRRIATDGTITTVVGTGTAGYDKSETTATGAKIHSPSGLAISSSGDLYFADTLNHVVRKVTASGTISTVAGNNTSGYSGNAAAATLAQLNTPLGVAVDSSGNLYIADTFNHVIRKVGTDGNISTVAGNGVAGYYGDGGLATAAHLNYPQSVTIAPSGELIVADTINHVIRKFREGGNITTIAGNGDYGFGGDRGPALKATFFYPRSAAVDTDGSLYIVDTLNSRIRKVGADGIVVTVAGNGKYADWGNTGAATSMPLFFPWGLAVNGSGNVVVSDSQSSKIRLLTVVKPPLNLGPDPTATIDTVISAVDFGGLPAAAPGSWVEIRGRNLSSTSRAWTAADFQGPLAPTQLDSVRVSVGGRDAYIAAVSPDVLRVQLPSDVDAGAQPVTVRNASGTSAPWQLNLQATAPGIQAPPQLVIGGRQYAAALLADGSTFALPAGSLPGTASRPAAPGETIYLYGTGFGPVTPSLKAGEVVEQENLLQLPLKVTVGGVNAIVASAGLSTGSVGVYKLAVVVPDGISGDAVPIGLTLDGTPMAQSIFVAVSSPVSE
jgi:uncharacterized protein (TIGR03437 family)